jgi:O-succinylbenzoate synthase
MRTATELAKEGPLRIGRIEAWRVRIPMLEPFRISSGEVADKEAILVRLSDGDAFGWGESSAMGGGFYSADTPDSCQQELVDRVLPALIGREFADIAHLETMLAGLTSSRFVRVALETAAWELLARKRDVSLQKLFGIDRRSIPSGLAIGLYSSPDELWHAIERYRYHDYLRLKIKIKRGQDVELVSKVRLLLDRFPLFVDANADYRPEHISVFEKLDRYGLMMFEQPMAKDDFEGSAELQRTVSTPVCLDESIETVEDARRAIDLGSCRIVNIKLQRVGGFLEAIRIMEECVAHEIGLWMGTMPELGVGSAQALILGAHPAFTLPTDVEPSKRWYVDDILEQPLRLNCGKLSIPQGPGLGFTIDLEKVRQYSIANWRFEP